MPFGDTETLTPEEAASLGTPKSAPSTPKVVGSESLPKVVGEPVDVFSDVEAFKVWKASQPAQDKWETVKAFSKEMGTQFWEFAKEIPSLAGQTARGLINPTKLPEALKANAAFVAEVGAEAYKGYAVMGKYMMSAGQKGLAASAETLGADKEAQKFHEEEALKAEMDFYRTTRDLTSTVNDGRVILDNVKNTVVGAINEEWAGENTLNNTEVNIEAARFAANLVDPDVGAVLTKAAMRGYAGKIVGKLVNLAPPEGMIRAAERDVIAAIAARSDAQEALLAAKAAGADTGKLTADLSKAEQDLIEANQYLRTRLAELDQQAAVGKGTAQQVAGKGVEFAGRGVEKFGQVVGGINRRIGEVVDNFGSGGGEAAVRGAIDTVPGVGWINRLDNAFESAGSQIKVAGQYISAAESSLGYFQSLARALPEDTVGRWAASRMERFENLATTGRWIMDSVDTTAKTTAVGAAFGTLSGDATAGATQGFWFGMAGSQFGQFARMNSPEEVRARQQVDVAIARKRRENAPGEQAKLFDEAGAGLQLATATFEQAYPDLNIKFVRGGGKRSAGWYENKGLFGEITIDLDHPTPVAGLLTHEVKHDLGRNPEIKQAVEAKILGDPNTGEIGIFTALDEQGRPILEETPSAENPEVTQKRFKLRPEFDKYRDEYLQRLRDANEPTIEYERDPRMIAHEIWAESEAANLLGRQTNGKFDIIAQAQMGRVQRLVADAVAGSDLVKSTAFLQKALAKFGVVFDSEGKAANTGLFSTSFELKGLNKAVEKYNRLRSDERAINSDPDFRDARLYTEAEILASPQLMEMYSGGHDVVRDPVTGKMRFIPEKEAKKRATEFVDTLKKELSAYTGNEPGVVREQTVIDANGREAKVWRGTNVPETVLKKMEDSGRFNAVQLKTLRDLNQTLKLGLGNETNFMYQPASKRGGKQYRTRPITERTETPMSIQITQDGNVVINTISQEKLIRNAVEAIKADKATLWGNDFKALWADVGTYLRNHQNGESGAANGLGVEKRDFINSLFGQFTKAQREANPLIQEVSDRKARNAGIVQSRRLDRTNKLTVLSTKFKPDYGSVSRNFSPAKADAPGTKVPGTPEPKADGPGTKVTETPEFKKWSGDKPVFRAEDIDTANPPRRGVFEVYHGTKEDVTEFKAKYPDGLIFTTPDPKFAGEWGQNRNLDGRSPRNYPKDVEAGDKARADALRPADDAQMPEWEKYFDTPEYREPRRAKSAADTNVMKLFANVEKAFDPRKDYKIVEPLLRTLPGYEGIIAKGSHKVGNWIVYENKAVVDLLKSKGYDAMWLKESALDDKHDTLAVFSPNQLKSATGNKGTFDPKNPDIRYSPGNTSSLSTTDRSNANQSNSEGPQTDSTRLGYRVDPAAAGKRFHGAIARAASEHRKGAAVEVKSPEFYSDPANEYFLAEDDSAGAAVKPDGDLVSVFKHPASKVRMSDLLTEASQKAKKLDGFDIDGFLPTYYSKFGFRPVARVAFADEFAPPNWNFDENGRPDNVFMVRDPENKLGLPDASDYNAVREQVPLVSFDEAVKIQADAIKRLPVPLGRQAIDRAATVTLKNQTEVAKFLGDLMRERMGSNLDDMSPETAATLAKLLDEELSYALTMPANANAIGWYSHEMKVVLDILRDPALGFDLDNPVNRGVFNVILAITSNGQKVIPQFLKTAELYNGWRKTGKIPRLGKWGGERNSAMKGHVAFINELLDAVGPEKAVEFLSQDRELGAHMDVLYGMVAEANGLPVEASVKAKTAAVKKYLGATLPGGEWKSYVAVGAVLLGPKLGGGFFANLYGKFDRLTMDRWFMRTFHRLTGRLGEIDETGIQTAIQRTRVVLGEAATNMDDAEVTKHLVTEGKKAFKEYREINKGLKQKPGDPTLLARDELRKAYNNQYVKAKSGMFDAPDNGGHRAFIRDVLEQVHKLREGRGEAKIDTSDIQAVLWYLEKDIWARLRSGPNNEPETLKSAAETPDEDVADDDADDDAGRVSYSDGARELYRQVTGREYIPTP